MKNLVCPISDQRINERVSRLNALFAITIILVGFATNSPALFILLTVDFMVRAFIDSKYSPVNFASQQMSQALGLQVRLIDKAPKVFAARLGFLMTATVTVLFLFGLKTASIVVSSILIFFATLEVAFALCVGCLIYTYLVLPFYNK